MQPKLYKYILISASIVLSLFYLGFSNAQAAMRVDAGPPSGFEMLEAPRRTYVTLYYGGEALGSFAAQFSPTTLSFDHPEAILAMIPTANDNSDIGAILASPLPTHPELRCGVKKTVDCGVLKPAVAGIIFDENRLSAELFIHPNYLNVQADERYLPLPERKFSSVYRFDGAVSGGSQAMANYTLASSAIFALGEGNVDTETSMTNHGLRFDTLSANAERRGVSANAGLIRSISSQLVGDRDMAGVSVVTSNRTRLDTHKVEGNDIVVYLPRRAYVSLYREGRLYSSRSYDAGNQKLDTSELPDGAYTITIKIQEIGGSAREEIRFYAKSEHMPPPDAPNYYGQVGLLRQPSWRESALPEVTDKPLLRVGTDQRVTDNLALNASIVGLSDRAVAETGAYMIESGLETQGAALLSSRGDAGLQAGLIYTNTRWNAALDARKLWTGAETPNTYDALLAGLMQGTMSVSYLPWPEVTLTARASYARAENQPAAISFGPELNWRLWQEGEGLLGFAMSAARTNGRNEGTALLRFSYRLGDYGITGDGGHGVGGASSGAYGSTRIWRDYINPEESSQIGAGIHDDRRSKSVSADGNWRGRLGNGQGSVQQSIGRNAGLAYGGNISLAAAQAEDALHIGGFDNSKSALSIVLEGDKAIELGIYINGVARGTIHGGESQAVYVTPYAMYQVRLAPLKPDMLSVEGDERKITLYPGNVARLHWRVHRFRVVTGRVTAISGALLTDSVLEESKATVTTDADGRFQAELISLERLHFITREGRHCEVVLPESVQAVNNVYIYRKPLVCQ